MTIFAAMILAAVGFIAVAYPFLERRQESVTVGRDESSKELLFKRDTAYSMLKELEFDYRAGNLSDEDYRELEERYKARAVSILKKIDDLGNEPPPQDTIEAEVIKLRKGSGFCTQCGSQRSSGACFCPDCGNRF